MISNVLESLEGSRNFENGPSAEEEGVGVVRDNTVHQLQPLQLRALCLRLLKSGVCLRLVYELRGERGATKVHEFLAA